MNEPKVLDQAQGQNWALWHGDCVPVLAGIPDNSIGYSIYSPPFGPSMYTYSASPHDIGNGKDHDEFRDQMRFLATELLRVLKPGRLMSVHCMQLPRGKARDGFIGLRDFRGDLIRLFEEAGFIYHSEVCVWTDPVTAMQRTKALGLLHKTIRNDSSMSRNGLPDYLITFRKDGKNPEPIAHTSEEFPVELWQRFASPVWATIGEQRLDGFYEISGDIDRGDTLQHRSAREDEDERHICPLQLEVIRRGIRLWSNPGDVVLTPFAGIGSELYVAIQEGRKAVGVELKSSYYAQAVRNLQAVEAESNRQMGLFG